MRIWPAIFTASALFALTAANAFAVSRPNYAKSYRGTLSGLTQFHGNGLTVESRWKVTGAVFRLYKVQNFEGGYTGLYKVTAGRVSYSENETGNCSYSGAMSFSLKKALPHPLTSVSLALDKDPLGRMTMLGLIDVTPKLNVTETCPDSQGGPPSTEQRKLDLPTLFDPGEESWHPGKTLHRTRTDREDNGKRSYTWNLKPGR